MSEIIPGEKVLRIAELILRDSLEDPQVRAAMEQMLADPTVTKEQIYCTAFAQGAIAALVAIHEGRLIPILNN